MVETKVAMISAEFWCHRWGNCLAKTGSYLNQLDNIPYGNSIIRNNLDDFGGIFI